MMKTSIENGRLTTSKDKLVKIIGLNNHGQLVVQKMNDTDLEPMIITDIDSFSFNFNQ